MCSNASCVPGVQLFICDMHSCYCCVLPAVKYPCVAHRCGVGLPYVCILTCIFLMFITCACCWYFVFLILTACESVMLFKSSCCLFCFQMSSVLLLILFRTVLSVCFWFSCVTSVPFSYFFCLAAVCVWLDPVCLLLVFMLVHVYLLLVLSYISCLPAADWCILLKSACCSSVSSFSCQCVCCFDIQVLCAYGWLFIHILSWQLVGAS